MAHPDNNEETEKIRAYISGAEAELNGLELRPRIMTKYPFDSVALAAVSKAFALAKACLTLLATGFPDEAYGLTRSLVECAINLRYLTQDLALSDQRTDDFIKYVLASKAFWLHYALQQFGGKAEEQQIREYAK
jgi:hypothetical protein